jgi:hypothetical protein
MRVDIMDYLKHGFETYLSNTLQHSHNYKRNGSGISSNWSEQSENSCEKGSNSKEPLSSVFSSENASRQLGDYVSIEESTQNYALFFSIPVENSCGIRLITGWVRYLLLAISIYGLPGRLRPLCLLRDILVHIQNYCRLALGDQDNYCLSVLNDVGGVQTYICLPWRLWPLKD